ncbi:LHY-like protein [Drosera capensis]
MESSQGLNEIADILCVLIRFGQVITIIDDKEEEEEEEEEDGEMRKPYTITKQRERWTEEEHNRFLEALKLHGRAWQRIEEHIGTKTAVQIRSHAQKFFSKLEREALSKGIPIGQSIDIDIPPPRPKRKPCYPYPRKTCGESSMLSSSGVTDGKQQTLASSGCDEQDPVDGDSRKKDHDSNCNKGLAPFQESEKHADKGKPSESQVTDGNVGNHIFNGAGAEEAANGLQNATDATKNFPRHVSLLILDGSHGTCSQAVSSDVSYQESLFCQMGSHILPALYPNPMQSVTGESQNSTSGSLAHPKLPAFHPLFTPSGNIQEHHSSFLQMSSTFSSLLVASLLQNPAAHAAASFAASLWPSPNVEASTQSAPGVMGGHHTKQMNPGPSMAALAAATVAAATAWWAAHGLLPVCAAPFDISTPPSKMAASPINPDKTTAMDLEKEENNLETVRLPDGDQELSEAKFPVTSSSDSGGSSGANLNREATAGDDDTMIPDVTHENDLSHAKNTKQVDRSSCDSNMASSSDVETDALGKLDKTEEDRKELNLSNSPGESSSRRSRNTCGINDSWKAVSEEGRVAFQALFLREVLPQSFSSPHDLNKKEGSKMGNEENSQSKQDETNNTLLLRLSSKSEELYSNDGAKEMHQPVAEDNEKEDLLTLGLAPSKLKAQRTGFRPYKRCSTEARGNTLASTGCQDLKNGSKRLRLEGEASS